MVKINNKLKIFLEGIKIGLFLQLAIGPAFFYILNLTLQKSIYDGLIAVLAVTIVDYFYIILSIIGFGKLLENKKYKKIFELISSIILVIFGTIILSKSFINGNPNSVEIFSENIFGSFISTFVLTISSPMTIIFFGSIFMQRSIKYNYNKKDLYIFGYSVGLATFIFLGTSVLLFTFLKKDIPFIVVQTMNVSVGIILIFYGILKTFKLKKNKKINN